MLLIDTEINNDKTFYTDSNGLELQKRILNHRNTWDYKLNEDVSGNYYPINGMIVLEDIQNGKKVALINDRP